MSDKFIAINVGTGDAFFLQRSNFCALVDGGMSRGFLSRLRRATSTDAVDVLVCTHNDADHANGILEFLVDGGTSKECWLPATWLEAVYRLCSADEKDLLSLLEDVDDELPETILRSEEEISGNQLNELLEKFIARESIPLWELVTRYLQGYFFFNKKFPQRYWRYLSENNEKIVDASRILEIAFEACKHQIPIRWFDPEKPVDAANPSTTCPQLSVLNAREVTSIRRSQMNLNNVLKLTTVNRLSLVLHSPGTDHAPDVLFCSDSGFQNLGELPKKNGMIITAPHHGSTDRENLAVYKLLDRNSSEPLQQTWLWVRSDRDCRSRPCSEYLNRKIRYCTQCRGQSNSQSPQDIIMNSKSGSWTSNSRLCNCN